MANNLNAFIGRPPMDKGMFFRAPLGTTLPEAALEELDEAFEDHGAVGENGLTIAPTRDTQDIKMAGGDTFATIQQSFDETITVELMEDDLPAVRKTTFGDSNVETTAATSSAGEQTTIYHTSEPLPISSFVLSAISGPKTKTYVIERGQVVNIAEIKVLHSDVTRSVLTIKTYKSSLPTMKGSNVMELRDNGVFSA